MSEALLLVAPRDTSFLGSEELPADLMLLQSEERLTDLQRERAVHIALVDLLDHEHCRAAAAAIHRVTPLRGAISFFEPWLELAAQITEDLNLPGEPLSAVRAARDKYLTRRLAEGSGLQNPRFAYAPAGSDLTGTIQEIGLPCVVKPAQGAGSEGVQVLPDRAALATLNHPQGACIVEQYIDGDELSIESFTRDGRHEVVGVTSKTVTGGSFRVELAHVMPLALPSEMLQLLSSAVCHLLDRIGHVVGPAHTEVKIDHGVPYLIETHTRYGGDRIWQMTGLTTGRYPQPATIAAYLGRDEPVSPPQARAAAVRFLHPPEGRVTLVDGVAEALKLPWVIDVDVAVEAGSMVNPLRSSGDRAGVVLTVGSTPEEAATRADAAASLVRIHTEQLT